MELSKKALILAVGTLLILPAVVVARWLILGDVPTQASSQLAIAAAATSGGLLFGYHVARTYPGANESKSEAESQLSFRQNVLVWIVVVIGLALLFPVMIFLRALISVIYEMIPARIGTIFGIAAFSAGIGVYLGRLLGGSFRRRNSAKN